MKMTKEQIINTLEKWHRAWDNHDLEGILEFCHDDVLFENWTGGRANGKEALRKGWKPWFRNHGGFRFTPEDTFIDEDEQKVLYRWQLDWPSLEAGYEGKPEKRRGIDIFHFQDGKIIQKLTYSKTTLEIDGERVRLAAATS
jgi:ketosteroid isomerase-like protein